MRLHGLGGMMLRVLRVLLLLLLMRVLWLLRCLGLCGVCSVVHGLLLVAPSQIGLLRSSRIRRLTVPSGMVSECVRRR
jgi:hypothetical protein